MLDDLRYGQGHDSHGTDRDIFGGGKELGEGINAVIEIKMEAGTHTIDGDADEG